MPSPRVPGARPDGEDGGEEEQEAGGDGYLLPQPHSH
jgi:hypothetical protein